jgi:hypothetical protein
MASDMEDDLTYVRARLPGYTSYSDEDALHDNDMRVRAYVGERLTSAQGRVGALDAPLQTSLDDVLMRCMFSDQTFVKNFEHAELEGPLGAALVRSDRRLVTLGERADAIQSGNAHELDALLDEIGHQLDARREPEEITAP